MTYPCFSRISALKRKSLGLSLPELLVAVLIAVPILAVTVSIFSKQVRGVTETWDETIAVALAQRCAANVKGTPYASISTGVDVTYTHPSPQFARYACAWRAELVAISFTSTSGSISSSGTDVGYKRVVVTVKKGPNVIKTMSFLVAS